MAAHRYWRVTGLLVQGSTLELTDAMLLVAGAVPSPAPTLSATFAPASGTLSTLLNGTTADVVSWPAAVVKSPGFALVFDCGVAGIDSPGLRLGAGSSRATFPQDLTLQFSDNGIFWENYQSYVGLTYPGASTLTDFVAPVAGDPDYASVTLLLDGASLVDLSATPASITAFGNAGLSTAQSKFGGASLVFDGAGDGLNINKSKLIGLGDLTIECWLRLATTSVDCEILCIGAITGLNQYDLVFESKSGGALRGSLQNGAGTVQLDLTTTTGLLSVDTWNHVAFSVQSSTGRLFVGGVQSASGSVSGTRAQSRSDGRVGYLSNVAPYDRSYSGHIDELRVTKGVARYTSNFTPPTTAFATATTVIPANRVMSTDQATPRPLEFAPTLKSVAGAELDAFSVYSLQTNGYTASDMEHGGSGRIYGTTKEKNTPSNTPLSRRVLLTDERSQLIIRETWSDSATGAFEFRDLALGRPYTTISYDHLRNYRAVIADNQLPELQA